MRLTLRSKLKAAVAEECRFGTAASPKKAAHRRPSKELAAKLERPVHRSSSPVDSQNVENGPTIKKILSPLRHIDNPSKDVD